MIFEPRHSSRWLGASELLVVLEEEGEPVVVCGLHSVTRHCELWAIGFLWFAGHAVHLLVVNLEDFDGNRWLRLGHRSSATRDVAFPVWFE